MKSWIRLHVRGWAISSVAGFAWALGLFCGGCAHEEQAGGGPRGEAAAGNEVTVSGELLTIEPVSWPVVVRVQGSLSADEISTIAAQVSGRIVEVNCDLGDVVSAGQTLIKLDDTEYKLRVVQAEGQLAQVRAAIGLKPEDPVSKLDPLRAPPVRETRALLDEAKLTVARLRKLYEQNAVVATDLEAALSAEQVADARFNSSLNSVREKMALVEVQSAQLELAKQQLLDTTIVAPLDGVVLNRLVAVGTFIPVGEPVVELAKTNVLRFRASVPERFAQRLMVGQRVLITIAGKQRETAVERISPALDPLSRSLVFEALVPNVDNVLRSGLFSQAEIVLDETATAIAIPSSALVRFAGIDKVWRMTDGKVSEAVLQIGREVNGMFEVREGLNHGDRILVNGASGRVGKYLPAGEPPAVEELVATRVAHEPALVNEKSPTSASPADKATTGTEPKENQPVEDKPLEKISVEKISVAEQPAASAESKSPTTADKL